MRERRGDVACGDANKGDGEMGSVPTARRRRRAQLLQVSFVLFALFSAGLVSAGVVSGAGPLAALSDSTPTEAATEPTGSETTTEPTTSTTGSTETTTTEPQSTEETPLPAGPPTITSDKPDYAPGELVTLTGASWQPGESVNIDVNDDQGQTWRRNVDVVASSSGQITDTFNLPEWFVAEYRVTAAGPISGTASTTFTDGDIRVRAGRPPGNANTAVTIASGDLKLFASSNCSGTASSSNANAFTTGGGTGNGYANPSPAMNAAAGTSLSVQVPASVTVGLLTYVFSSWQSDSTNATHVATGGTTGCFLSNSPGQISLTANYAPVPVNSAPIANNVSDSTNEDTPKEIALSASDVQQCELAFSILSGPTNGTLGSISNNACTAGSPNADTASVTYTPNGNFSGSDSFTYKVNDGSLDSNTATVSITVNAVDDAPTAVDDSATVNEDSGANAIDVLPNDTDPDGGTKSIQSVTQPANGNVAITGGGTGLTYAPNANYCNGGSPTDDFTYTLNGGSSATVSVTVTCVDDPPVIAFTSGATSVDEGQTETYVFSVTDPDSTSFTYDAGYPKCGVGGTLVGTPSLGATSGSFQCQFADGPASPPVAARIRDATSASNEATRAVTVNNVAPTVSFTAGDQTVDEGQTRTYTFSVSDPGQDTFTALAGFPDCGTGGSLVGGSYSPSASGGSFQCSFPDGPASPTVRMQVEDSDGDDSNVASRAVTVNNVAPSATFNNNGPVNEGSNINLSLTDPSDPSSVDTAAGFQYRFSCNGGTTWTDWGASSTHSCPTDDNGTKAVRGAIRDKDLGANEYSANVTINNVAPTIQSITTDGLVFPVGSGPTLTITFTDPGTGDVHTCTVNWESGTSTGTVSGTDATRTCTASRSYTSAGVYTITVTIADDDGGSDTETAPFLIVIYDPSAGFVTGGGWINSPAGAYREDLSLAGKANFGFVSKYKKGASAPEGQTEFQFHAGSFNFHSESYHWLVVAGAKAQFKGTGKVNGSSGYGFLLTATDGQQNGGGGTDKFRIKVWRVSDGAIVYDNSYGTSEDIDNANPQAISGGSIVIHSGK
jgi:hypothetical protein